MKGNMLRKALAIGLSLLLVPGLPLQPVTEMLGNAGVMASAIDITDIIGPKAADGTEYSITVGATQNGTLDVGSRTAKKDDEVTIYYTPAFGYELDTLTVTMGSEVVPFKQLGENELLLADTQLFVMPEGDVNVTATFKELPELGSTAVDDQKYRFVPKETGAYCFRFEGGSDMMRSTIASEESNRLATGNKKLFAELTAGKIYVVSAGPGVIFVGGDPAEPATYPVSVQKVEKHSIAVTQPAAHGEITKVFPVFSNSLTEITEAYEGEDVAVVIAPEEGYGIRSATAAVTGGTKPIELKPYGFDFDGTPLYIFEMPAGNVDITAEMGIGFTEASVSLKEDLGLNFIVGSANADNYQDFTVKFKGECEENGKTFTLAPKTIDGRTVYCATANVSADHINDFITAELYKNGQLESVKPYSVNNYITYLLNNATDQALGDLAHALLQYGQVARSYFGGGTAYGSLGTADAQDELESLQVKDLSINGTAVTYDDPAAKLSLVLNSKMAVRLYPKETAVGTDGKLDGETDGIKSFAGARSTADYPSFFEISKVKVTELAKERTVTVGNDTYTFSPLTWALRVINNEDADKNDIMMASAITDYAFYADVYAKNATT
ncbi:MAG: hypothetical protein J5851_01950 [Oscillospiraceae bacterium]|nr:hypothetical protein [Oscillospiraceae bacterium]